MENIGKYLLYICNMILVGLIVCNIMSYDIENKDITVFALETKENRYISYLEKTNEKIEIKEPIVEEMLVVPKEENKIEIKEEQSVISTPVIEETKEVEDAPEQQKTEESNEIALETLVGNLVGYGPDCHGCTSMKTASGKYIGEGNIYYEDEAYGKVRIVAGDYSYPFGTIVKISNVDFYNDEPFYAVVLDRGGNIGKDKKFMFDLLFASEKEALSLGKEVNIKFEIMRLGY